MSFAISVKLDGLKRLERQLRNLADPKTAKKIQRRAATAAIRPIRNAVKRECPDESGALKRSIDSKVSVKESGMSAIVGSNTAILETGERAKEKGEGPRAARHLHLVLFGHVTPDGKAVAGNNFMQRGYESSIGQARAIYEAKLKEGIENVGE